MMNYTEAIEYLQHTQNPVNSIFGDHEEVNLDITDGEICLTYCQYIDQYESGEEYRTGLTEIEQDFPIIKNLTFYPGYGPLHEGKPLD